MKRLFCVYTEWFTLAPLLIFGVLLIIVIIDIIVVDIIFVAVVNMIIIIVSSPSTNQKMAYLCYKQTLQFYPTLIITITIFTIAILYIMSRSGAHTPSLKCSHYSG